VARSLKRLRTTGVDYLYRLSSKSQKNVENKCIYLRPYRKHGCHSADSLATRTTLHMYRRVAKTQPAAIRHSASSYTAVRCCASNSVLRAHAQTETRIYWRGGKRNRKSYCPTSFVSEHEECTDGFRYYPRPVFRRVSALQSF
jgi:hypothetical protein